MIMQALLECEGVQMKEGDLAEIEIETTKDQSYWSLIISRVKEMAEKIQMQPYPFNAA